MGSPLLAFLRSEPPTLNPAPAGWKETLAAFTEQARLSVEQARANYDRDRSARRAHAKRYGYPDRSPSPGSLYWLHRGPKFDYLDELYDREYVSGLVLTSAEGYLASVIELHRRLVREAFNRGEDVPAEVLADYPNLVPRPPSSAAPPRPSGEWRYGVLNRPVAPGTVPRGRLRVDPDPRFVHGVVVYEAPLSDADVAAYELAPLPDVAPEDR
jgi:hypothetical protein